MTGRDARVDPTGLLVVVRPQTTRPVPVTVVPSFFPVHPREPTSRRGTERVWGGRNEKGSDTLGEVSEVDGGGTISGKGRREGDGHSGRGTSETGRVRVTPVK